MISRQEFSNAYEKYHHRTVRYLLGNGVPAQQAEETAQAAWTRGWEKRNTLREIASLSSWINRIALNIFRNRYRREQRMEQLGDLDRSALPQHVATRLDMQKLLGRCCGADERRLLAEAYVEGYSSDEIAARRGLKATTVRVRVFRLRKRIREFLAEDPMGAAVAPSAG